MLNGTTAVRLAIIGAIVALICIAGVIVTAALFSHGADSHSTPILTTVLGLIGTTVTALLALLAVIGVDRKVNGHIARLTAIATEAAAQSGDPNLAAKAEEATALAANSLSGKPCPPTTPPTA